VLFLLTALNLINYLDRYVIAAVLPLIEAELGLSHAKAGGLASMFILVLALTSPFAGWLGDRWSRVRLASASAALFGLATFATGLAGGYPSLVAARALTGVGEAGYGTVTPSLLSDVYPPERRSRALSTFYAALPVGAALGYLLGGLVGPRWGWRTAFFLAGGPALALALAALSLREPRRGALDPTPTPTANPTTTATTTAGLRLLLSRRSFLANTAGQILITFALGGLGFWMPSYLHGDRGVSLEVAGTGFGAILAAAGFVGTLGGGALADRAARRHAGAYFGIPGWCLLAAAPCVAAGVLASQPAVYWTAMFVAVTLAFAYNGPLTAALVNVVPPQLRATAMALNVLLIHLLGDAISPWFLGVLADRAGLRTAVLFVAAPMIAGGLLLVMSRKLLVADLRAPAGSPAPGLQ
jgi:MFS family permease